MTSACLVVAAALFVLYYFGMLAWVKREHEKQMEAVERSLGQRDAHGGGTVDKRAHGRFGAIGSDPGRIV